MIEQTARLTRFSVASGTFAAVEINALTESLTLCLLMGKRTTIQFGMLDLTFHNLQAKEWRFQQEPLLTVVIC